MKTFLIHMIDKHLVALFLFGALLHTILILNTNYVNRTVYYFSKPVVQQCVTVEEDIATAKRLLNLK